MRQVIWTPIAESEFEDILFYIAIIDRRPETAERIYYEIRDRVHEQIYQHISTPRYLTIGDI